MKVEEAMEIVCPFIQNIAAIISNIEIKQFSNFNTAVKYNLPANINCICGDCMAWEYTNTHDNVETKRGCESEPKNKTLIREHGTVGNMFRTYGVEREENIKEGYCRRLVN